MATYSRSVSAGAPTFASITEQVSCVAFNTVSIVAGDLTLNTVIPLVRLPAYARVFDVVLYCTDMDTSGSPTLAFHVGDTGDNDRFISGAAATAAIALRAGNNATAAASLAAHTRYTAETVINATVSTAAATAAAGTINVAVTYVVERPAS